MRNWLTLVAALLAGACALPETRTPPRERPNILFILVDDMGFSDPSVTGNRKVATPNIDRLATEGLLMTRFRVASPICSPSRAAFMTGHFPAEHRIVSYLDGRARNREMGNADWLDADVPTVADALRAAGYATGHFGKWHLGGGRDIGDAPLPTEYGFDESYTQFEGLGPRVLMTEDHYRLSTQSLALGRGPIDRSPKSRTTARYVDRMLDFIDRQRGRPWFVHLWPDDVHDPWTPNETQMAAVRGRGDDADEERFFATLVALDAEIGRLVGELARRGELDRTLIVLTGDNGPTAAAGYYRGGATPPGGDGGFRGRKGSLYEGGVRQPLIVRWPAGVRAGRVDEVTDASAVDLWPTLAEVARAAPPLRADGISLRRAWEAAPVGRRPDLFFAYGGFGVPGKSPKPFLQRDRSPPFAIVSGEWKLLAQGDGSDPELYRLSVDPTETRDVAAEHAAIAKRLAARLATWRRSLPQ